MCKINAPHCFLFFLFTSAIAFPVLANNAAINMRGHVKASPCKVMIKSVNVDLGKFSLEDLIKDGQSSNVKFKLELNNCPLTTKAVTATFSGRPFPDFEKWRYANEGTAKDVGIALTTEYGGALGNGTSYTVQVDSKDRTAIFNLLAMVKKGKSPTSGSIKGAVEVTFVYK